MIRLAQLVEGKKKATWPFFAGGGRACCTGNDMTRDPPDISKSSETPRDLAVALDVLHLYVSALEREERTYFADILHRFVMMGDSSIIQRSTRAALMALVEDE